MVSVKNEINEILLNCVSDLENRLEESRNVLSDIQGKMDSKVSEAKEYKVQVDDAKENIKRLESEIDTLENDLVELKDKYSKKNLVAVIDAGTREINAEIKKKQDEIQIHKNKIAELTNRAKSIKDLLMNLKKDKKIKEERLKDLEKSVNYYKVRLEDVVKFAEEHDNLDDYFVTYEATDAVLSNNVFEDIAEIEDIDKEDINDNVLEEEQEEVSIEEADAVFDDVINSEDVEDEATDAITINVDSDDTDDEIELDGELNISEDLNTTLEFEETNDLEFNLNNEEDIEEEKDVLEFNDLSDTNMDLDFSKTTELKIDDLLQAVKEPVSLEKKNINDNPLEKLNNINETIDKEFENVFGQDINEPIKTVDIFGNEYKEENTEEELVNKLTNMGLDYYSFTDADKKLIESNFNEQVIADIVNILKTNKIQLDNLYVDGSVLSSIAPAELEAIINKLLSAGQSAEAIGYVLDKLPLVDLNLLNVTLNNYGDYIKNVDIVDIIFNSLKGDK